jgi:hypothetical protein
VDWKLQTNIVLWAAWDECVMSTNNENPRGENLANLGRKKSALGDKSESANFTLYFSICLWLMFYDVHVAIACCWGARPGDPLSARVYTLVLIIYLRNTFQFAVHGCWYRRVQMRKAQGPLVKLVPQINFPRRERRRRTFFSFRWPAKNPFCMPRAARLTMPFCIPGNCWLNEMEKDWRNNRWIRLV